MPAADLFSPVFMAGFYFLYLKVIAIQISLQLCPSNS